MMAAAPPLAVLYPGSMYTAASPWGEKTVSAEPTVTQPLSTAWRLRLPVELLLQCLMAADLATRIQASHVSRIWREAALEEHRLWDNFSCSTFRNRQHEDAMFALLEAMLLRSRPLPFHLTIPHLGYYFQNPEYTDRLLGVKELDVFRLATYRGPVGVFKLLNPTHAPLPNLICLDILRRYSGGRLDTTRIEMAGQLDARCLPNLQHLVAPYVQFPSDSAPFEALQSITFAGICGVYHRTLFAHCPRLVRMVIADSQLGMPLPDPPVPPSLEVSIICTPPRGLDLLEPMRHWDGVRVRRLIAREVYSLQGILSLFAASHEKPIELRLVEHEETVVLSTIPDDESVWTISPSLPWASDILASIEKPTSERLTSFCIGYSRLAALLTAKLHVPGLEKVELCLDSLRNAQAPPLPTGDEGFLHAPRLRSIFFDISNDGADSLLVPLSVLQASFRSLLVYDAELLDAVFVTHRAWRVCAVFAPFAKEYALATRGT